MATDQSVTKQDNEDNVPWFLITFFAMTIFGIAGVVWYCNQPEERQQEIDSHTKKLIEIISKKCFDDLTPAEVQHYLGIIKGQK